MRKQNINTNYEFVEDFAPSVDKKTIKCKFRIYPNIAAALKATFLFKKKSAVNQLRLIANKHCVFYVYYIFEEPYINRG